MAMRSLSNLIWITMAVAFAGCASPSRQPPAAHHAVETVDSLGRAHENSMTASDSTSVDAAVSAIREYYHAIDAGDYARAYRLWGSEGAASGKTYERFAAGFDSTAHVDVTVGEPGAIGGAAGSRYVEIPVVIHAVTRQGDAQRFQGSYVMRRSEVDGATEAQRRWRIYSAKITRAQ
jgi:hypothetical protein